MKHALVVGGSGMLSGTVGWLVKEGYHVSVVGRTKRKMKNVLKYKNVSPLYLEYNDSKALKSAIKGTIVENGPIELVIAWIHSHAKQALHDAISIVTEYQKKVDLYHVVGSTTNLEKVKNEITAPRNSVYYQVQLGAIKEDSSSRWLTSEEISEGVIEAVKNQRKTYIVGTINDWEEF